MRLSSLIRPRRKRGKRPAAQRPSTFGRASRPLCLEQLEERLLLDASPDLKLAGATAPPSALLGTVAPASFSVVNQGTDAARLPWYDAVYLSDDTVFSPGSDRLLQYQYAGDQVPLAAGAGYTRTTALPFPTDVGPGNRYLLFVTGAFSSLPDADPTNNVQAVSITLTTPDVDLVVPHVTAPASAALGQPFTLSWTVQNQGGEAAAAQWSDVIYVSDQPTLDATAVYVDTVYAGADSPLAAGAGYTRTWDVTLNGVTAGSHYLLVVANGSGDQAETNPTNNVTAVPITLTVPPVDLTVGAATAVPTSAQPGDAITVTWTVTNQGSEAASTAWYDSIYLSAQPTFDPDTAIALLHEYQGAHASLVAGDSYVTSDTVTLPAGAASGTQYLLVVTDSFNYQLETDETNNVRAVPITLTAPDLVVSAPAAPASARLGDTIPIAFTVTNQGAGQAAGNWTDSLYLSDTPTLDGTATPVASIPHTGLVPASGGSYTVSQDVLLPGHTAIGSRYLLFVADSGYDRPESDETNNVTALPITLLGRPDLAVTAASSPASVAVGGQAAVSFTVANQGSEDAGTDWADAVYLSTKAFLDGTATLLASAPRAGQPPLGPGGSYSATRTVTIPGSTTPGPRFLLFVADHTGQLTDRLRAARSDAVKGEAWVLVGEGPVRRAALLELAEAPAR